MNYRKYPTKPLECWQKAKELRLNHYKEMITARDQGKIVVQGGANAILSLVAGLGDFVFLGGEPYGASIGFDPTFSEQCAMAAEAKGFARDLCAYMRNYLGSMFLDRYYFGGRFPKPHFCMSTHICDTHAKWFQIVGDHLSVPHIAIDYPVSPSHQRKEQKIEYLASQMHDCIERMERIVGRVYSDEKLIEAARNEFKTMALWGEICLMNKTIPAPLDQKSMFSLYVLPLQTRHRRETVDFYELLKEEVTDRVRNQIAAVATERFRYMDDSQPPWYYLKVFRYLEKYGAVSVGSYYSFLLMGMMEEKDGSWAPKKTPEEKGIMLHSREDVLRALAQWYLERSALCMLFSSQEKSTQMISMVNQWQVRGVIMHLNRGCEGTAMGQLENRLALIKAGIPVLTFESNMADRREFDETQILDRLDAFMQSQGLRILEGL
jgi:benzoyl-CoA reductase subunit B